MPAETSVYAAGQRVWRSGTFEHRRPVVGGWLASGPDRYATREERDPAGGELPLADPSPPETYVSTKFGAPLYIEGGDPFDYASGYEIDGLPVSAQEFARRAGSGSVDLAVQGRDGRWQAQPLGPHNYFAGGGGASIWVDHGYESIERAHADEGEVERVYTDIEDHGGHWAFLPIGFGGQQAKSQKSGVEFLPPGGSYGDKAQERVRETLANIVFSDKCAKAFKDAELKTPFELLLKGIVVGPATLLSNPSNASSIGITESARRRDAGIVGSTSVQGITIRDHPGYKPDTTDGRARIFLNSSAFGGGAFSLGEVLTHEFIHVAGVDAKPPGFFGSLAGRHDLSYYDKYQSIIDACK